ncbi:Cytoplasmic dynein 1 heavy chain 1, partial [Paramuricea clavata]
MKIFSSQLFVLVLLYCCIVSLASSAPTSTPKSPAQPNSGLGPLEVSRGQVTFDSEGNDIPGNIYFSRKPHVPSSASGITIGRGYDLKERKRCPVHKDLLRAGIPANIARIFSRGVGLKGQEAKNYLKKNNLQDYTITHEQQKKLFYIVYDPIAADAERLATKDDVVKKFGKTDWAKLNNAIKEIVIDLRYRGDYTPTTRNKIQRAIVANDLKLFTELMSDENYWRKKIGVPEDRFLRRKNYLSQAMSHLAQLVPFDNLPGYIQSHRDFFQWCEGLNPENNVPVCWESNVELSPLGNSLYQLLVVQAFRPDRVLTMVHKVVETVFGQSFLRASEQELDLAFIVEKEIKSNTPILMCSVPGHDASGRVDDLVAQQNKQCTAIAIGSAEGFNLAEKAVNSAVKSGRWVLLKNVHLAPQWLVTLEKKLHTLNCHANFRLFLTMEINPKVPVNLLRASRVFVFEPPPGIKANLFRTFSTIPAARMCRAPTERTRLYFLLAWLHAIIQERLRYAPLGWSKHYEFSESDLRVACDTIDTWLDNSSQGRTNISPDKVPWDALRTLLTQAIYGGRIDNEFDQRLLSSFVNRLFTVNSFESDFPLVLDVDGVKGKNVNMPDGIRREQFVQWTEKLPDSQSPSWLGLPNNAEKLLLTVQGQALTAKLLKMQNLEDEEELAYSPGLARSNSLISSDARPAWMRTLHTTASNWLAMVPEKLAALKRTNENIKDPLFRFFEREVNVGIGLLTTVRNDLQNVISVCEQVKKPTNYLRSVMSDLMKAILPKNWRRYTVPLSLTVIQWIADFSDRIQQLRQVSQVSHSGSSKGLKNMRVRLGWLFVPEAYITATRQYVAQANNWSLEELFLKMTVSRGKNDEVQLDDCSFGITGLRLQGAKCVNNRLELATVISTDLPLTSLSWI